MYCSVGNSVVAVCHVVKAAELLVLGFSVMRDLFDLVVVDTGFKLLKLIITLI